MSNRLSKLLHPILMGLFDFFNKPPSKDEFAQSMVQSFRTHGINSATYNSEQFSVELGPGDSGGTMFLENFYFDYCRASRSERKQMPMKLVEQRVRGTAESNSMEFTPDRLLPVVRDFSYLWFCAAQISTNNFTAKYATSGVGLGSSHQVSLVLDAPEQTMQVTDQVLASMKMSFPEALVRAAENLRDISPDSWSPIGPGAFVGTWNDSFDCSRILLPDILYRLNLPGNPVAMTPARGVLLVSSSNNTEGQIAILSVAQDILERNNRWTSAELLEHHDGKWHTYSPVDPSVQRLQHELQRRFDAGRYSQQKGLLEQQLRSQGKDIFVTSYLAYEKDKRSFSIATWSDGVEAYLPKADYLVFVKPGPDNNNDMVVVPWSVGYELMQAEMLELPGVLPVRFHVTDFPDAQMLEALRQHHTELT